LEAYKSIAEFFTRDLKPGLRPISSEPVSPVDGTLRNFGPVKEGRIPQIKSKTYSLEKFLGDQEIAKQFQDSFFCSLYLAPHDYHHVHSPVSGKIVRTDYLPGNLWPVTNWSLATVDNLFSKNERIISYIESNIGLLALVMVGATNVGKMTLSYHDFVSNQILKSGQREAFSIVHEKPFDIAAGDRLGTFHLGSTVVLLFEDASRLVTIEKVTEVHKKVHYGEDLAGLFV